jgi:hypothetical protein
MATGEGPRPQAAMGHDMTESASDKELAASKSAGVPTTESIAPSGEVRRKLLQAGAIGMPVAISLQSGTARAISTCTTNITRPTESQVNAALSDSSNISAITAATGLNSGQINAIKNQTNALDPGAPFPESSSVHSSEVLWLMVNTTSGGSCWTSYCANSIDSGDVTVVGAFSSAVCGGGAPGGGCGDDSDDSDCDDEDEEDDD